MLFSATRRRHTNESLLATSLITIATRERSMRTSRGITERDRRYRLRATDAEKIFNCAQRYHQTESRREKNP
jgi:hypothetical protein